MIDINNFVFFAKGSVEIGIESSAVDRIFFSLKNTSIKKEHLAASTPKKKYSYDQFWIQKKLITAADFKNFVSDTLYVTESEKEGWGWVWNGKWLKVKDVSWKNPFLNNSDLFYKENSDVFPVMQISWNDAFEYTKWLNSVTGKNLRLPFEYEWEIFADYCGLKSIDKSETEALEKINSDDEYIKQLYHKIKNSEFQLGLLWEWVQDWYNAYDETIVNKDFGNIYKTLRGGSLLSENIQKTKEFRFRRCPTARSPYYGFRTVLINPV